MGGISILSFPAGCICQVDQRKACAKKCGLPWDDEKEYAPCKLDVGLGPAVVEE